MTSKTALALTSGVIAATIASVLAGLASTGAIAGSEHAKQPLVAPNSEVNGDLSYAEATKFTGYQLYSAGETSPDGSRLTAITFRDDKADPALPAGAHPDGAHWVNFVYSAGCQGDGSEGNCDSLPQVQVWPACQRNLSVYVTADSADQMQYDKVIVRGVPAAFFEGDEMLEVYTGDATVVIFGDSRDEMFKLAAALQSVNASAVGTPVVMPGDDLPEPASGAMEGRLECTTPESTGAR